MYVISGENGELLMIELYIDDLLLAGNKSRSINWMKIEIAKAFEMKDLEEAKVCIDSLV